MSVLTVFDCTSTRNHLESRVLSGTAWLGPENVTPYRDLISDWNMVTWYKKHLAGWQTIATQRVLEKKGY